MRFTRDCGPAPNVFAITTSVYTLHDVTYMIGLMVTRGRPRDAQIDSGILEATRALLLEVGYAGVGMESVAARAGVGKPTVYRRYSTKAALVYEAVFGKTKVLDIPDSGDLRADLIE